MSQPNVMPDGFLLLQNHNGKPLYAACLDGGRFHGWLMSKHPNGQWVSKRKLESWEVMQAEDQRDDGIIHETGSEKDPLARRASQVSAAAPAESIGEVTTMPGTSGFTMAVFKAADVPVGTKLFRASEGQAQTSAAAWATGVPEVPVGDYEQFIVACKRANGKTYVFAAYYLNGKRLLSRWGDDTDESEDGTPVMGWFFENEVDGDNVFEPVCPEGDEVTHWQAMPSAPDAQLADSTAPGAPVGMTVPLDCALAALAHMAKSNDHAAQLEALEMLKSAATTAQQSLTAGGAVPEVRLVVSTETKGEAIIVEVNARQGDTLTPIYSRKHCLNGTVIGTAVFPASEFAAAPLPPQVQPSEPDDGEVVCDECGLLRGESRLLSAIGDAKREAQRAADQQAANPVADSNGGVGAVRNRTHSARRFEADPMRNETLLVPGTTEVRDE